MSGSGGIHPLSRHSPQIPVLRSGSVNPRDTGSKQTGRKVKARRRPKLKLTLSWPGGHHNRKGCADCGGGGEEEVDRDEAGGRGRRSRRQLSMGNHGGNVRLREILFRTKRFFTHLYGVC